MNKELKIIQCQRLPAVEGKVKIKFLKSCLMEEKQRKIGEIEEVEISKPLSLVATIENKRKNAEVQYQVIIEPHIKKK